MEKMEPEYLEAIIKRFQRDNTIHRVLWIKTEPAAPAGENYLSIVTRIKAGVLLGSGTKRTVSVVVKVVLQESATAQWSVESGIFAGEIKVYTNILHKMSELMYEFGDKREKLWPELIAHESLKMVFEDLKESDFKVANRNDCLDVAHGKLVVRNIARLHAMSKVLLQRHSISPADVLPYPLVADREFTDKLYGNGLKVLAREMKSWGPEWTDIRERLIKCSNNLAERLVALNKPDENNFNVINHGDNWTCNLMFKYDPYDNLPISLRFVDFQLTHYQSYGWDLIYFLYTSLLGDTRRKYFNELVKDYSISLRESLLMYDYPEHEIPDLDDVNREVERLNLFTLPLCTLTHAVMTMPVENSYNLNEGLRPEEFENCGYNIDVFRGRYKDEIGPDLRRFAELGII